MPSLLSAIAGALEASGVDLAGVALTWARATPAVVLIPAFGLRALPAPGRALIGLALAMSIFPASGAAGATPSQEAWLPALFAEVARGLPVAVATAVPLWAATMAGGVADALRGAGDAPAMATVEGRATPLGVAMSLFACAAFLRTGGPARLALALARPSRDSPALATAAHLVDGIQLALRLGAPLLVAAVVVEIASALVARAAAPAQVHTLLAPLRAVATLTVLSLVLERFAAALSVAVAAP